MFQFHQEHPERIRRLKSRDELLAELRYNLRRELQILDLNQFQSFGDMCQREWRFREYKKLFLGRILKNLNRKWLNFFVFGSTHLVFCLDPPHSGCS